LARHKQKTQTNII